MPRIKGSGEQDAFLHIRIPEQMYVQLQKAAAAKGISVSETVRGLIENMLMEKAWKGWKAGKRKNI